jgi:cytochrome c
MDSFEWNKIIGAVLGTLLFIVGLNIVIGGLLAPKKPERPGIDVAVTETPTHDGGGPVADVIPDWGTVLPTADVAAGEKVAQRCLQCHVFEKGGPNKIGPNLYGIVGAKHANNATYTTYSAPMRALADKTWGYDELEAFVKNPKGAVPGTKMLFAGLSKVADRVNLIAYLRTRSDSALAIPAPRPAEPPSVEPSGDAEGEPPASPPAGASAPEGTPAHETGTPAPATPAQPASGGGDH